MRTTLTRLDPQGEDGVFLFFILASVKGLDLGVTWDWEEFLAPLTSLLHEGKTKALLGSSFTWKHRRKFAVLNFLFVGWRFSEPTQCGAHCLPEQKDKQKDRWLPRAIGHFERSPQFC